MKRITITRQVEGPMVDWLVFFKGEFVGCGLTDEDAPSYDAAIELAKKFLADRKLGNVPERYMI